MKQIHAMILALKIFYTFPNDYLGILAVKLWTHTPEVAEQHTKANSESGRMPKFQSVIKPQMKL